MKFCFEIFFSKKLVTTEEWREFIQAISFYNGTFRKWKLWVVLDQNQLRYFVQTRRFLPVTIRSLNSFVLKRTSMFPLKYYKHTLIGNLKIGNNFIDLIQSCETFHKGKFCYLEFIFQKVSQEKVLSSTYYYLEKHQFVNRYKILFRAPADILAVDFMKNQLFFLKGVPKYLEMKQSFDLLQNSSQNAFLKADPFPYRQGDLYLSQFSYSFDKHSLILGTSGCGKSKFISLYIKNILEHPELASKYKFVVIDPHASLESDIGGLGTTIDFLSPQSSIDLFTSHSEDILADTELMLDLMHSLLADRFCSKLERVLRHSIYLLLFNQSFCFQNLRKLLLDLEYRNQLIQMKKCDLPSSVLDFFLTEFQEIKSKSYGEAISPIIGFLDEMELVPAFSYEGREDDLKTVLEKESLTLFSLNRMKLGSHVIKTIAGLIMNQLFQLVQQKFISQHIVFIIDEVSVIETPVLSKFLSEARKYGVSLILAGQYFNQISKDLKDSIFANVIHYYLFRLSRIDANEIVDALGMKIPLDNSREKKIEMLTGLQNRECIVRLEAQGKLFSPFKGVTLDYVSVPRKVEKVERSIISFPSSKQSITTFQIDADVSLHDILVSNSTSRKEV